MGSECYKMVENKYKSLTKFAYIFPGQGAQYVGMGKDIYENFDYAKRIFDIASNVTGEDLVQLCFEGPKEDLADTVLCQIAIFTVSIVCLKYFLSSINENIDIIPTATAGLSLGEYTALVFAGCISFEDGINLVLRRARYMQESAEEIKGSMVSIIGLKESKVDKICKEADVDIANLNCPGQIVISGESEKIKEAVKLVKEYDAKRVIPLKVKGAYHSRLMAPARDKLKKFIQKIDIKPPQTLFISNVTGRYHINPDEIKENLIAQVDSSVYWQKSMELMLDTGVTTFLEIGPGKVLAGLLRRIDRSLSIYNIETKSDIDNFINEM